MKQLFIALFLCFMLVAPAGSQQDDNKPFLAVFCQPEFAEDWKEEEPDYLMTSRNWGDFKLFISEVKRLSGGRPLRIDIDSHGNICGHLYFDPEKTTDPGTEASMGYILNQVDRLPPGQVQLVTLEACFAGWVYNQSLHQGYDAEFQGNVLENYKPNVAPAYPVYGVSNISNWNNAVYAQYITNEFVDFQDLRKYEQESPGEPILDKNDRVMALKYFYAFYHLCEILDKLLTAQ